MEMSVSLAFENAAQALQTDSYDEQRTAAEYILAGRDVFVSFPTGFDKSAIYHVLPSVMKFLRFEGPYHSPENPIVVIASPLKALIDQVTILVLGLTAAVGSPETDSLVMKGLWSLACGSPEALVGSKKWLDALQMSPLRENVVT